MKRPMLVLTAALVLLTSTAAPVAARTAAISMSGTGAATLACAGGEAPPCAETIVVTYVGTVSGSPFVDRRGRPERAVFTGTIRFPASTLDEGNCSSQATGTFALATRQGKRVRLAFELAASGSFCMGTFQGTFVIDSSRTREREYRRSTGSGVIHLQSDLDVLQAGTRPAAFSLTGTMEVRR